MGRNSRRGAGKGKGERRSEGMEAQRIDAERSSGPGKGRIRLPLSFLISAVCVALWLIARSGSRGVDLRQTRLWEWMTFDTAHPARPGLLIHPFLHEAWHHLLTVVTILATFGRILEERWGTLRFGLFYLGAALVGGISVLLVDLCRSGTAAGTGGVAGGAIALGGGASALACLAAYSVVVDDGVLMGWITRRQAIWAAIILGAVGLVALEEPSGDAGPSRLLLTPQLAGIAWGLVACLPRPLAGPQRGRASVANPARRPELVREDTVEIHHRVDEILSKISRSGMESLSREERSFLQSASKHFRNQP